MATPLWIQLTALLLALSGWGKVAFDLLTAKPKVRGRIFNVMRAQMPDPNVAGKYLPAYIAYPYLVNLRKNSVHLLDYELEAKCQGKWIKLRRVYGIHNVANFEFLAADGSKVIVEKFAENLIYRKNQAAEFGKPLHGWVMFVGAPGQSELEVEEYRLSCIDVYGDKHVIRNAPTTFGNIFLLEDVANISIPPSARVRPNARGSQQ